MTSERGRKRAPGLVVFWVVIAAVAALFIFRFIQVSARAPVASITSVQQTEGKPVEVVKAASGRLESWTNLAGTVEGSFQYPIVSTNSIAVVEVVKHEGDRVRTGDVVIRLERIAVNAMLYSYDRSLALYQDAVADRERMRNLYREGAVSKQALEKAELGVEVAKADLTNAKGSTDLVASHAGIVTSVLVKEGEMANAYSPLAWIARTDSVRVRFTAGSRQAMVLRVGQKAVWESTVNGASLSGVVNAFDLSADPSSHLVHGETLFPNPGGTLIPGVLASFRVLTGERAKAVKIPSECLVESKGRYHVFVAEAAEGGKLVARRREVAPGLRTTDEVEIVSGVAAGDRVVRFGQTLLEDGDPLKIVRGGEVK